MSIEIVGTIFAATGLGIAGFFLAALRDVLKDILESVGTMRDSLHGINLHLKQMNGSIARTDERLTESNARLADHMNQDVKRETTTISTLNAILKHVVKL